MPNQAKEEILDSLLKETEKDIKKEQKASIEADKAIMREIEAIEGGKTTAELQIQRDILSGEVDLTKKIEAELWTGAHIACLPYFYETYTIQARIEPDLQKKYNKATIAACSRFKALGKNGLAMVSPIVDYTRNYSSYKSEDRKNLDEEVIKRVVTWLRLDIVPDSKSRPALSRSLERILSDVVEAEQVFMRASPEAVYLEGEVQMAAVKAIRNSQFLPSLVKIRLLQALKAMNTGEISDIAVFLLWEIRKSSHHQHLLLYTMLKIFKNLNSTLI